MGKKKAKIWRFNRIERLKERFEDLTEKREWQGEGEGEVQVQYDQGNVQMILKLEVFLCMYVAIIYQTKSFDFMGSSFNIFNK